MLCKKTLQKILQHKEQPPVFIGCPLVKDLIRSWGWTQNSDLRHRYQPGSCRYWAMQNTNAGTALPRVIRVSLTHTN